MATSKGKRSSRSSRGSRRAPREPQAEWPSDGFLLHGTSTKGLQKLRRSRSATALFLTDDENTAAEYAESNTRRDALRGHRTARPVIVTLDTRAMRAAGGELRHDMDDDEIIFEHFIYSGPFSASMIVRVEGVTDEDLGLPRARRAQGRSSGRR